MARLAIEECFWTDPRFKLLAKKLDSEFKAIGVIITFWRLAQEQFKQGKLVSPKQFKIAGLPDALFTCELAENTDAGIRAKGDEKHFGWLISKKSAGKLGGVLSGKSRSNKINNLTEAKRSKLKQNEPLSSSSFSSSSSSSSSKEKQILLHNSKVEPPENLELIPEQPPARPKASLDFDFESLYEKYPRKIGKTLGMKKLKSTVKDKERFKKLSLAVDNYSKWCQDNATEEQYIKHWSTFANQWEDWVTWSPAKPVKKRAIASAIDELFRKREQRAEK